MNRGGMEEATLWYRAKGLVQHSYPHGPFKGLHCFQPKWNPVSLSRRPKSMCLIVYPDSSTLAASQTAPTLLY